MKSNGMEWKRPQPKCAPVRCVDSDNIPETFRFRK